MLMKHVEESDTQSVVFTEEIGQEYKNLHECEVLIEKSVLKVTVWHHEAVMPNCDPRDRFLDQYLTLMIDSFSCTPMGVDT